MAGPQLLSLQPDEHNAVEAMQWVSSSVAYVSVCSNPPPGQPVPRVPAPRALPYNPGPRRVWVQASPRTLAR